MRFAPRPPLDPIPMRYDVIISQNFGRPIDGWKARTQPNGGSELHTVVVAEGLYRAGLRVAVIQPGTNFVRWSGVDYYSYQDVAVRGLYGLSCEVLISQRFGKLPPNVEFKRLCVEMHDLPDDRLETNGVMGFMSEVPGTKTILHSRFNDDLYANFPGKTVIPAAFEEFLYDLPKMPRTTDRRDRVFVHGSAALKGLAQTLQLWGELKRHKYEFKKAKLIVTSPGYDSPEFDKLRDTPGVIYEQQKTLGDMQQRIANSDGLFQVNALPETFGCVHVQAEIAGRPAWVFGINGPGALKEVLANPWSIHTNIDEFVNAVAAPKWPDLAPARDYRMTTLLPQWLEAIGFNHAPQNVTEVVTELT